MKSYPDFLPIAYDVVAGQTYRWCGCGQSKSQPLCDREDCKEQCVTYRALITETVHFCGCKKTKEPPFCDGSHAELLMNYVKGSK